jgi:ankyrin repeat protein
VQIQGQIMTNQNTSKQNTKWFLIAIALQCVIGFVLKEIYPLPQPDASVTQSTSLSSSSTPRSSSDIAIIEKERDNTRALGVTRLMQAAGNGNCDEVTNLLRSGEDVLKRNRNGTDALIYASSAGHIACVAALLKAGANTNTVDSAGDSALSAAKQQGFSDIVTLIENAQHSK